MPDREAELSRQLQEARDRIEKRLERIETAVSALDGKVGRVSAEIGFGLPDPNERGNRPTLRDRMHLIESDDHTLRALAGGLTDQLTQTAAVVNDLKQERDHLEIERAARDRRWTRLRVVVVTTCAAIGGVAAIIGAIGVLARI